MPEHTRLNKYLAHHTGISRREADNWISQGRVSVNGTPAILGTVIQPGRDYLAIDDRPMKGSIEAYTYLLLNKPVGYVCSRRKQGDNPTIYSLLPPQYHHLKVAGRLDKDSCGLLLLTDDGDTIFKLTHPKFAKQKVYIVELNRELTAEDRMKISSGVELEDGTSLLEISQLQTAKRPNVYKVIMHEGRNRQIRRTFGELRYSVAHLERSSFGKYDDSDIAQGQFKIVELRL